MKIKAGIVKRIHVNRQVMASNRKNGGDAPPITVQTSKGPLRAHIVEGRGFRVVHAGERRGIKPLSCGARVWIETKSEVTYE